MNSLIVNYDQCTGCQICELRCSLARTGGFNPHQARLKIDFLEDEIFDFPHVCQQCRYAACVKVCPTGALEVDEEAEVVNLESEECIGCKACVEQCPRDMIWFDERKGKSYKCELCGGDPLCVKYCPSGALQYEGGVE